MRRPLLVALALTLAGIAGLVLVVGRWGEQVEHAVRPENPGVRAPQGVFVESVPGRTARLWAIGDADGPPGRRLAATITRGEPDRVLYLGDVYERGTPRSFAAWSRSWGGLAEQTAPTPGNHDWQEASDGYDPYWRVVRGKLPPAYYAFTAAGWDVVSINSEAAHEAGSEQERWLRERVAATRGTCRLVFWHRPRFSAGPHGDEPSVDALWRGIAGGARIVVSGHEHNSQRLRPRDGVVQFVAGAGGRALMDVDREDPRLAFGDGRRIAALRLDLEPGRARYAFVDTRDRVLDRGELRCAPLRR